MIPKCVKVGGYTVTIRYKDDLLTDHGCVGRYLPRTKEIEIDPSFSKENCYATFLHEVTEAITEIYDIKGLAENHHDLTIFAEALHQLIRDNGSEILPK